MGVPTLVLAVPELASCCRSRTVTSEHSLFGWLNMLLERDCQPAACPAPDKGICGANNVACSREQICTDVMLEYGRRNLIGMHIMCLHIKCLPAKRPAAPCAGAGHGRATWLPQSLWSHGSCPCNKITGLLSYQVAAKHPDHTLEKPKSQIFSSGRLPLLQSWDSKRFSSFRSRFATPCRHAQNCSRNGQQLSRHA